jgi:hypothetical protein
MRALACLAVAAATASLASAAVADRTVTSPGKAQALARSGYSVAFLSGPYARHCGSHVRLWDLATGGVYRLGLHPDVVCNEGSSTGTGIADIAVAGNRVLWLFYAGGLTRDWVIFTATATRPHERMLEFRPVEYDAPPPIVLGTGSEAVLPYSIGPTVKVLGADGAKRYTWTAPGRVTNTTAYQGQVAVFVKGGTCYVLSASGSVQQTYKFPVGAVQEFALAGAGLVVQLTGGKVEIRNGRVVRKLTLPAGARMLDYAEGILLYKLGTQIRGRRVATGRDALLRNATFATLEHNGLSYAFGRRVSSVAMVNVQAMLGR